MELSILMPCLNEAKTIKKCIDDARIFLHRMQIDGEVLIADNGSTDGSVEIARQCGARVIFVDRRGYGAALMGGIQAAKGRYIIMGDADDSYSFLLLDEFINALRDGADLVMGNRFKGGISKGAMPFLHRWLGNPVLSALGRIFFKVPIGDFHCGLRGFKAESIRHIHLRAEGMEFATEMVAKAAFSNLVVTEVPTTLKPDGRGRPPHLRTWRDGWRHLKFMLLYSPIWLFILPGLILLLLGSAGVAALISGPIAVAGIGFDFHTLIFCGAAINIGVQAIQWGMFTQWIGVSSGMRVLQSGGGGKKWWSLFSHLEFGIIVGAVLFLSGFIWSFALASNWISSEFSEITNSDVIRKAIVSCTLMVLGLQVVGGSLFAGALKSAMESGYIRIRADGK